MQAEPFWAPDIATRVQENDADITRPIQVTPIAEWMNDCANTRTSTRMLLLLDGFSEEAW